MLAHAVSTPKPPMFLTPEVNQYLQEQEPNLYWKPTKISLKPIYHDTIAMILTNCPNPAVSEQALESFEAFGFDNLTIYHGLIARKEGDLELLSNLSGTDRVAYEGYSIPRACVVHAAIIAACATKCGLLVSHRNTEGIVRRYMKSISRLLAGVALRQ